MPYFGTQPVVEAQTIADGTITNDDVNASAAIAKSKLASLGIVNADVDASAAIAQSKLADIVNADIASGAAIAKSKLASLGIVNADVDASAAIAQSKLVDIVNADVDASAAIATSKLSGALTSVASHGLATSATTDTTNASNLASGTVPTARLGSGTANSSSFLRGDGAWAAAGGGKVLQVVQAAVTSGATTTSTSYTTTGLEVSITPSASSSKILVLANAQMGQYGPQQAVALYRDGGNIMDNSRNFNSSAYQNGDQGSALWNISLVFLDSPSSTSSETYQLMYKVSSSTGYFNRSYNHSDRGGYATITAIELDFS